MKGLLLEVLRSDQGKRPQNILDGKSRVIGIAEELPPLFSVSQDVPAVQIVRRQVFGREYLTAYPLNEAGEPVKGMYGGSFVYSCDSRFRAISPYPIPLHDRVEQHAQR